MKKILTVIISCMSVGLFMLGGCYDDPTKKSLPFATGGETFFDLDPGITAEALMDILTIQYTSASGSLLEGDPLHEIPYHIIDSGQNGAVVMFIGGMHGNEYAGFQAVETGVNFVPLKGKIIVVPRANKYAIDNNRRDLPFNDSYYDADPASGDDDDGNLDRYFPEPGQSPDEAYAHTALGKEIWNLVKDNNVKWLLNCHESREYRYYDSSRTGQGLIHFSDPTDGLYLVNQLNSDLVTIDGITPADPSYVYKKITLLSNPVSGSLTRAVSDVWDSSVSEDKRAFTFETARDSAFESPPPIEERIKYHKRAMKWMLVKAQLINTSPTSFMHTQPTMYNGPITVSWEARGGYAPFEYTVERATSINGTWVPLYAGPSATTTFSSGVTGRGYYFRVKARSADTETFGTAYGDYSVNTEATYTFSAGADATIKEDDPDANFGSDYTLRVDDIPVTKFYIKFTVSNVVFPITTARIYLYYSAGSPESGGNLRLVSGNSWSEGSITYNNRPLHSIASYGSLGPVTSNSYCYFDVTPLITANGTYSFAIVSAHNDGCTIKSSEASSNKPYLYIQK